MKMKDIVQDNRVRFSFYRKGIAYYLVNVEQKDADYIFPVPLEDIGDATLYAEDKAIMFMRYIRKAIDDGTFVKN